MLKLIACLLCVRNVCQTWQPWMSGVSHQCQLISSSPHNALCRAHTLRAKVMFIPLAADMRPLVTYLGLTSKKSKVRWKGTLFSPFSFDPCMTDTGKKGEVLQGLILLQFYFRRLKLAAEKTSLCSQRTLCSCTYVLDIWLVQGLFDKIFTKLHCK